MFHEFDPYESLQELQRLVNLLQQKTTAQDQVIQQLVQVINNQSNLSNQHTQIVNDLNHRLQVIEGFDCFSPNKIT